MKCVIFTRIKSQVTFAQANTQRHSHCDLAGKLGVKWVKMTICPHHMMHHVNSPQIKTDQTLIAARKHKR